MKPYNRRNPIKFPKKRDVIHGNLKRLGFVNWWEAETGDVVSKKVVRRNNRKMCQL